ncbi:ASCH domain-containing protein [Paracoccus sp. M683]|nr:ASCH domain-containing protein [Paracoccus sp. M683]TRW98235.1 ASCH domain-containing protein [Paracoccus sp. M683]
MAASGGDISTSEKAVGFTFGDSRALNAELLDLVRSGRKTATCGALRDFQDGGEAMPVVGRQDVALDWNGKPALLIETVEVTIRRFCDLPEDFALAEGEGDFEAWKTGHIAFFTRNGGFDPQMELVCERFRLVEVLS